MQTDSVSPLLVMKCEICHTETVDPFQPVCRQCYKKKYHLQLTLYLYKRKFEKEGMAVFQRTHKNHKFTMQYIITQLFYYKIANTRLGRFYRELNLKGQ